MQNEFQLIDFIKNKFSTDLIGDDAAIIPLNSNDNLVISKDILIENTHFILNGDLNFIGSKALISNLSDIIAMGVEPKFFLLGLGLPENFTNEKTEYLLNGIHSTAQQYNVILAGGDISKSEKLFISITVLGFGEKEKIVYRNTAQLGDDIWIAGELGDSEIGLRIIKKELKTTEKLSRYFIKKHFVKKLHPDFISFLSYKKIINSMIDVSDGFLQDLLHLLKQSDKCAIVNENLLPVSTEFLKLKNMLNEEFYIIPLISGEEYALIFTANPCFRKDILDIACNFSVKISKVGTITDNIPSSKHRIKLNNLKFENLAKLGYTHFS